MQRLNNLYDITKRLCGDIEPIGESNIDATRLENLDDTIHLINCLSRDVIDIAKHKDSHQHSVRLIGEKADRFITNMAEELNPGLTFTEDEILQLQYKVGKITGDGTVMMLFNELLGISSGK